MQCYFYINNNFLKTLQIWSKKDLLLCLVHKFFHSNPWRYCLRSTCVIGHCGRDNTPNRQVWKVLHFISRGRSIWTFCTTARKPSLNRFSGMSIERSTWSMLLRQGASMHTIRCCVRRFLVYHQNWENKASQTCSVETVQEWEEKQKEEKLTLWS